MNSKALLATILTLSGSAQDNATDACSRTLNTLSRDMYRCAEAYPTPFCFEMVVVGRRPEMSCQSYEHMCREWCELSYQNGECAGRCQ